MRLLWYIILGALSLFAVRPGMNVRSREASPSSTDPTDTSQTFASVVIERGRTDKAFKVTSWTDAQRTIGARLSWNAIYWDAIEQFFKRGGAVLWLSRIVGPAAVKALANLDDGSAGSPYSMTVTAVGEGDWYNGIRVDVETDPNNSSARRVHVYHNVDTSVNEYSLYEITQQALKDWSQNSRYIRLDLGGSTNMPVNAVAVPLTLGADDRASVTETQRRVALRKFTKNLGTGQMTIPGATLAATWTSIMTVANETDRNAVLDYPDTEDEATLTTLAGTARSLGRVGAGFAGWLRVPLEGSSSLKSVAPSLAVCAKIAVWDAESKGLGQNKPVAGPKRGVLNGVLDVSQQWLDEDKNTRLNSAGVNLIKNLNGVVTIYGWRSLVDEQTDKGWVNFGHRRLQTALYAKGSAVMGQFAFDEIDGEGHLLGDLNGKLRDIVVAPYYKVGSLYGATPAEAYTVDTTSVNDATTAQNRELHAVITVVESEFAEELTLEIVKNLITEGVGA